MTSVKAILSSKGTDIWSVEPTNTVLAAIELMAAKNIGAVLVLDGEKLVGIVTERDYARKVILEGRSSKDSPVKEVMSTDVLCVSPERTVDECMALMTDKRARHLPVLDHKRVIGIISIGDVVKAQIHDQQIVIEHLQNYISGY